MNVLFRSPNWIGDAVLALPSVAALAGRSDVRLTVLAPPYVHPVYEGLPGALLSPVDPRVRNALHARALGRALAGDDEVAILCPTSFSSALVALLARIPRRIGRIGDGRFFLLSERLPAWRLPPTPIPPAGPDDGAGGGSGAPDDGSCFHRWRDYAELTERALGSDVPERYPLQVSDAAEAEAELLLDGVPGAGRLVGLNPGANWPSRRWPLERFAALGCALRDRVEARVVVVGGPGDIGPAAKLATAVPGARSLAGRTDLKTLMAVLRRLDLFVTNDTGPMHLAAALGTRVLDLCGAADERVTGPRGPRAAVLRERLFCSPCRRNVCPYDLECMDALTVGRVLEAAVVAMANGEGS